VIARWQGNRQLQLVHHPAARVFKAEPEVRGVVLRYTTASDPQALPAR
jgi:hypothetical protein